MKQQLSPAVARTADRTGLLVDLQGRRFTCYLKASMPFSI